MGIKIYTYADPYYINKESYWNEIKTYPIYTASQTLANGMKTVYGLDTNITTITNLLNNYLYRDWFSVSTTIKQHAAIDNILADLEIDSFTKMENNNLSSSFTFNRDEVFKSIRVLFELGIKVENVNKSIISKEQLYLLNLYKKLQQSNYNNVFCVPNLMDSASIKEAIKKSLENYDFHNYPLEAIVIQGVHQFTPIMLKAIEEISRHFNVILIFNYQSQFKNIFQTWINVYSMFEQKIDIYDGKVSFPNKDDVQYDSVKLAYNFGKLVEGKLSEIDVNDSFEIIEFDNIMEFAAYVSDVYSKAMRIRDDKNTNVLRLMDEQFYSASDMVNSILKMYYPDQFGERHFLNYPLGQFFVAITNMWDPEKNEPYITDLNVLRECFSSKIIYEKRPGSLNTLYQLAFPLFEGCTTIKQMISRLESIGKEKVRLTDSESKKLNRISYLNLNDNDINELMYGLKDLDSISREFFHDFKYGMTDFKTFYKNIKAKLEDRLEDFHDLDVEFESIIQRVLERLDQVENIDANASFQCLKSTMSIYLQQESFVSSRANWIVRNFEQIDGDILLSRSKKSVYHFSCLNDEELIDKKLMRYSWPLNDDFFVYAQTPTDWKYMTYVTSKAEYMNFKMYALFYGLLFNKSKFKLSYIKHSDDKILEMHYLLRMLNPKVVPYEETVISKWLDFSSDDPERETEVNYNVADYYRYKICHYKFLIESLIEHDTVYKDQFLIKKYMEVLLENILKLQLNGKIISPALIDSQIDMVYFEYKRRFFPFIKSTDEIDIKKKVKTRLLKIKKKPFKLNDYEEMYMNIKELFIHNQMGQNSLKLTNPVTQREIDVLLNSDNLYENKYYSTQSAWCTFCANKELCGKIRKDG